MFSEPGLEGAWKETTGVQDSGLYFNSTVFWRAFCGHNSRTPRWQNSGILTIPGEVTCYWPMVDFGATQLALILVLFLTNEVALSKGHKVSEPLLPPCHRAGGEAGCHSEGEDTVPEPSAH